MVAPVIDSRAPANLAKLTAAVVAGWIAYEGFSAQPYIPTKGDVPTIGHGATHYEDGRRVSMADPGITRTRAADLAVNLLEKEYAPCVRRSLGSTPVHPVEFGSAVDFAGQYGCGAWASSPMPRLMQSGQYLQACQAYVAYRFMTDSRARPGWTQYKTSPPRWKFDCATPGNRTCKGVWTRQLDRYLACMGAQH